MPRAATRPQIPTTTPRIQELERQLAAARAELESGDVVTFRGSWEFSVPLSEIFGDDEVIYLSSYRNGRYHDREVTRANITAQDIIEYALLDYSSLASLVSDLYQQEIISSVEFRDERANFESA